MVLCMLAFFCPICFSLIGAIVLGGITCYNVLCEMVYDRKLAALADQEQTLTRQIEELKKK